MLQGSKITAKNCYFTTISQAVQTWRKLTKHNVIFTKIKPKVLNNQSSVTGSVYKTHDKAKEKQTNI